MKSLFINTTGKNLILGFKDKNSFFSYESDDTKSQNEEIFPELNKILHKNKISDLDFIVVLSGPGSFTGIRLGLSIAKGFNIAIGIPVITLNNFMATFHSLKDKPEKFYISLPSGESELFVSKFSKDGTILSEGKLVKKSDFQVNDKVFFNEKIDTFSILSEIEKNFNKKDFIQSPISPTYIKPHYAKVKNK